MEVGRTATGATMGEDNRKCVEGRPGREGGAPVGFSEMAWLVTQPAPMKGGEGRCDFWHYNRWKGEESPYSHIC